MKTRYKDYAAEIETRQKYKCPFCGKEHNKRVISKKECQNQKLNNS